MINPTLTPYLTPNLFIITTKQSEYNFIKQVSSNTTDYTFEWIRGIEDLLSIVEMSYPSYTLLFSDNLPTDMLNSIDALTSILTITPNVSIIEVGTAKHFATASKYISIDILYDFEEDEETLKERLAKEEYLRFQENASKAVDKNGIPVERDTSLENLSKNITESVENLEKIDTTHAQEPVQAPVSVRDLDTLQKEKDNLTSTLATPTTLSPDSAALLDMNTQLLDELESYAKVVQQKDDAYAKLERTLFHTRQQSQRLQSELETKESIISEKEQQLENLETQLLAKVKELDERETNISRIHNKFQDSTTKNTTELQIARALNADLQDELAALKTEFASLKVLKDSQFDILKDLRLEKKGLEEELRVYQRKLSELTDELSALQNDHVGTDVLDNLKTEIDNKNVSISNLESQLTTMKRDFLKLKQEKAFVEEDYETLRKEYSDFVDSGVTANSDTFAKFTLQGKDLPNIFYFKVITQPTYFKSFITTLQRDLAHRGPTIFLFIREEDALTDSYYEGVNRYNHFDDVLPNTSYALITPNKFMISTQNEWYMSYKNIVIVDYTRTEQIFLEAQTMFLYYTYLNEKEKQFCGYKGNGTLHAGTTSIIDMSFDKRFLTVRTASLKQSLISAKVVSWLNTVLPN